MDVLMFMFLSRYNLAFKSAELPDGSMERHTILRCLAHGNQAHEVHYHVKPGKSKAFLGLRLTKIYCQICITCSKKCTVHCCYVTEIILSIM